MTCDDAQTIAEEIVAKYEDDLDVIGSKPHGEDDPCYLHCEKTSSLTLLLPCRRTLLICS